MRVWQILGCLIAISLPANSTGGQQGESSAQPLGRIILVPIDDRPAVGQFAQMVGAIADYRVEMPPVEMLGKFTTPGDTERVEAWLRAQEYSDVNALIVSVDMLAYGGLIASRVHNLHVEDARQRLAFFHWFKDKNRRIPVYAFSTIMRVAPTATAETRLTHDKLARWAELKDRVAKTGDKKLASDLDQISKALGPETTRNYLKTRERNLSINQDVIELVRSRVIDELIFLQDDARQYGLHRRDQTVLKERLKKYGLEKRAPIYNGADEGSISLVSRAVLDRDRDHPRVAVIYSSERSRTIIAPYEDHPLQFTVEHQIRAAGGIPVDRIAASDYRLFINAPGTSGEEFDIFLDRLIKDLKDGRKVALADLLFPPPHQSGADERIIAALKREKLFDRFAGYAAWNTAGNTLGTAIPHANMRVFQMKRIDRQPQRAVRAETAHLEFLLNRFAGDYLYHDIVRLQINRALRSEAKDGTATYQLAPDKYDQVNREVAEKMRTLIGDFFKENFQNRSYRTAGTTIAIKGLKDLRIYLPWPRTFECAIEFKLEIN